MKTIVSTIIAVTIFAGAASAGFDPFNDPSRAVPRSPGYEKVLGGTSNDDYRQALPRTSNDEFRDALPLVDVVFPDIVIATP